MRIRKKLLNVANSIADFYNLLINEEFATSMILLVIFAIIIPKPLMSHFPKWLANLVSNEFSLLFLIFPCFYVLWIIASYHILRFIKFIVNKFHLRNLSTLILPKELRHLKKVAFDTIKLYERDTKNKPGFISCEKALTDAFYKTIFDFIDSQKPCNKIINFDKTAHSLIYNLSRKILLSQRSTCNYGVLNCEPLKRTLLYMCKKSLGYFRNVHIISEEYRRLTLEKLYQDIQYGKKFEQNDFHDFQIKTLNNIEHYTDNQMIE